MELERLFAAGGPLAQVLAGYAPREEQLSMARQVAATLAGTGALLVEAGTGTGKTVAYLAPAVLAGKKVVVSTATKTLQAQILEKDVPLLSRALGAPISAALLKGRENYLCLRRFHQFRARPLFHDREDGGRYERLERWAGATTRGDRAELEDLPDDYRPWREVCSTSDTCWGSRCSWEADCHHLRQRRQAQRAQLVVVNHHLFCADLALRSDSVAEVIPRYGAVVFDEAHHLEAAATQFFGTRVSSYRVAELVRDAARLPQGAQDPLSGAARSALAALEAASGPFWAALPRERQQARLRQAIGGTAGTLLGTLLGALEHWSDRIAPVQADSQELENLFRRTQELARDLALFRGAPQPGEVRWLEPRGRGVFLHAVPVEVGPTLAAALFARDLPIVLTSATLRVAGSFAFLRERLGVPEAAEELAVASPFDYREQALLYVPRGAPDPNSDAFPDRAAEEITRVLGLSRGRAFCLFTSHRVLQAVADTLRGRLPFPLLVQGEAPREVLLRSFQRDIHSVLLGAQSFWEGVDVPGEALSAVIIDKIPFASPGDPLVEARLEQLRARGQNPFAHYQLPAAAMALQQGVGRLIRSTRDRGVVVVLDGRLLERSYGAFLRASLPPFPLTRDPEDVEGFFRGPGGA